MIAARIVADSVNPAGCRLTTFECVVPKQLVAQFNTHGMVRRVSESSRARPTLGIMRQVRREPYKPDGWRYRQTGMQPAGPMSDADAAEMDRIEASLRHVVLEHVAQMEALRAAKEDINRYLEPWMWSTLVAGATELENYLDLRDHVEAQGAHAALARLMREALAESTPVPRRPGETEAAWHLPYVTDRERDGIDARVLPLLSAARCGRVSYGRQGEARAWEEDLDRALGFVESKHWSPLDLPARATLGDEWYGPLQGWLSIRKHYAGESGSTQHGCQEDIRPWAVRRTR